MNTKKKVALVILDGWGIAPLWGGNAIAAAKTPFFDNLWRRYPKSILEASGEAVGLPQGVAGNSETGHLNIGAGRVVIEDLPFINSLIRNKEIYSNQKILDAIDHCKKNNSNLHLIGLVGLGFVHSDLNHLFVLLEIAKQNNFDRVFLDLFSDGRDSDQNSALGVIGSIERRIKEIGVGKITSISGRFFAMDRDHNWGRISRAYNAITKGEAEVFKTASSLISDAYSKGISDEFIEPAIVANNGNSNFVKDNDSIILFNFRPDRAREISLAFTAEKIPDLVDRKVLKNIKFLTFVIHDPRPIGIPVFPERHIDKPLAEVLKDNNMRQLHIAETEKYAHVTYFLNGGREKPFDGEKQVMIDSPKVRTYNLMPEMSAKKITSKIISDINEDFDFIVINYANADMVGHCGNFYSAIQAVECVDNELKKLVQLLTIHNYTICITADHGNVEEMVNFKTKRPQTEHTNNPVPFLIVSKNLNIVKTKLFPSGSLSNIAPTILELLLIKKPDEMTSGSLIIKSQNG